MKVLTVGHKYVAANFENKENGQTIQFIEKVLVDDATISLELKDLLKAEGNTLVTLNDGTTNEELIEVLLDRMKYLNDKFPCRENSMAITKLDEALLWLNKRTNDTLKRGVEGQY